MYRIEIKLYTKEYFAQDEQKGMMFDDIFVLMSVTILRTLFPIYHIVMI
jgi:hypothetical protein